MEDNKNFSDAIKTENENLLNNKDISNVENKSKKKSEHKKFVFNTNKTKSKLAFEIDFHGMEFDKIFKRIHIQK